MTDKRIASYGSWDSPLTAELITAGAIGLGQTAVQGDAVYWVELRPAEGGRTVLMRWTAEEGSIQLTPSPFNLRSRVHEYGGGAFWITGGPNGTDTIYFVNFEDQRIYRQRSSGEPQPITPPHVELRYADGTLDWKRSRLICVREDHTVAGEQPLNSLVAVELGGGDAGGRILVMGNDFYSTPRISPDGTSLAWLTWNHPDMPWDGTELWVGRLNDNGNVVDEVLVAGGRTESIFQPEWSPNGELYFVSDRSGWWNLYSWRAGGSVGVARREAEFGLPLWVFGMSTYDFTPDGRLVTLYFEEGQWHLAVVDETAGTIDPLELPFTELAYIRAGSGFVVLLAGAADSPRAVIRVDLENGEITILRQSMQLDVDSSYFSRPEAIRFPTTEGEAHAYFYPPHNPDFGGPAAEKPPLIVESHGGPTSRSPAELSLEIQYWTSRGFAVLDVNYRGSTGYGRHYREQLKEKWGVADVEDCINGARYLVEKGLVDERRLAIRGGSAGGYTTLCALTFYDVFHAGASYYGVSDVEALAEETHKFESRYLDSMIGAYPEQRERYRRRSPIHFTERLNRPVIFFQGTEDQVVPPSQAEKMVAALDARGVPVAYISFEGEYHGFRQAESIKRALEAELYFYSRLFGFEPAGKIEPVPIRNLDN